MTIQIVIADDHPAMGKACTRLLEDEYDVVAVVESGRDALAAIDELAPDLLVVDIEMPDMGGLEVLEVLRTRGIGARVVVLTQHLHQEVADRVFACGAEAYVTKARMARDLKPAVRAALAGDRFCSPLPA